MVDPTNVIMLAIVILVIGLGCGLFSRRIPAAKISSYAALIVLAIGLYLSVPDRQVSKKPWGATTPGAMMPYEQKQATDAFDASAKQAQKLQAESKWGAVTPKATFPWKAGAGLAATKQQAPFLDEQGNLKAEYRQPDAKTVADKWPMKPPEIVPLSPWVEMFTDSRKTLTLGSYRWVGVDGRLGLQSQLAHSASISFLPEPPATPAAAETKEEEKR